MLVNDIIRYVYTGFVYISKYDISRDIIYIYRNLETTFTLIARKMPTKYDQ